MLHKRLYLWSVREGMQDCPQSLGSYLPYTSSTSHLRANGKCSEYDSGFKFQGALSNMSFMCDDVVQLKDKNNRTCTDYAAQSLSQADSIHPWTRLSMA